MLDLVKTSFLAVFTQNLNTGLETSQNELFKGAKLKTFLSGGGGEGEGGTQALGLCFAGKHDDSQRTKGAL